MYVISKRLYKMGIAVIEIKVGGHLGKYERLMSFKKRI